VNAAYAVTGSSLKFRFVFYSNASGTREGAYVDDIALTGTPGEWASGGPTTLVCLSPPPEPEAPGAEPAAVSEWAPADGALRINTHYIDSGNSSKKRHTETTSMVLPPTSICSSSPLVTMVPDLRPNSAIASLKAATSRFRV
jgi:hypothetical protein